MATSIDVKDFTLTTAVTMKLTSLSGGHAAWAITQGTVAHDAVDADNPLKIGGQAAATLSTATLVSAGDRANAMMDLDGVLITRRNPLGDGISGTGIATASTSAVSCIAAAGSGVKTYLTDIILSNSDTTPTNTFVDILDGVTVKIAKVPVPAGGGCVIRLESPIGGTANTAWQFQSSASVTSLSVSMSGFKSKI